jgi:tyrosyl-tRNA synthetase
MFKAQIASRVLYESDYSMIKTEDVVSSLSGDSRLKIIDEGELLNTPVTKLAVQAKLVPSNCALFVNEYVLCHI